MRQQYFAVFLATIQCQITIHYKNSFTIILFSKKTLQYVKIESVFSSEPQVLLHKLPNYSYSFQSVGDVRERLIRGNTQQSIDLLLNVYNVY